MELLLCADDHRVRHDFITVGTLITDPQLCRTVQNYWDIRVTYSTNVCQLLLQLRLLLFQCAAHLLQVCNLVLKS